MSELEYPQPEFRDRFRAVVSAASDATVATSIGMNFFDLLIAPSLQKRRDEFFAQLGVDMATLNTRMNGLEDVLAGREDEFAVLALNAGLAAMRTTDEVKLQRLRNAALNGAVRSDIEASMGEMFLQAVSDLTPLHIEVLAYLSDPFEAVRARGLNSSRYDRGPRSAPFNAMFPGLGLHPHEMGGTILRELYARGFTLREDLAESSDQIVLIPWTTDLGLTFLAFIDPPWDEGGQRDHRS